MVGCCTVERYKFIQENGDVCPERMATLMKQMKEHGYSQDEIDRTAKCTCLCHRDGVHCMC